MSNGTPTSYLDALIGVTGPAGADGGTLPSAPVVGSQVVLGPAGQWTVGPVVTGTSTSSGSAFTGVTFPAIPLSPSQGLSLRMRVTGRIDILSGVSLFCQLSGVLGAVRSSNGTTDSTLVENSDTANQIAVVAPFNGMNIAASIVGNTIVITAGLGLIPAWAEPVAYTAGPLGTARHVVVYGGIVWVCESGGTSQGSTGPVGDNAAGGSAPNWASTGKASVTINWTGFFETLVG